MQSEQTAKHAVVKPATSSYFLQETPRLTRLSFMGLTVLTPSPSAINGWRAPPTGVSGVRERGLYKARGLRGQSPGVPGTALSGRHRTHRKKSHAYSRQAPQRSRHVTHKRRILTGKGQQDHSQEPTGPQRAFKRPQKHSSVFN